MSTFRAGTQPDFQVRADDGNGHLLDHDRLAGQLAHLAHDEVAQTDRGERSVRTGAAVADVESASG